MYKFVVLLTLLVAVMAQEDRHYREHPSGPPQRSRVSRQIPGAGGMPPVPGVPGGMQGPGNLGMQGLGNIPDPTVMVQKAQEVAAQMASGRRRRNV